jgi:DtxR family transcriptional regulator, Mn-dependent transcriptional regulator
MKYQDSSEMYIKTIYLLEKDHGHVHITDISKALNITKPSATKATELLKSRNLLEKEGYGPVKLTDEGKALAEKILNRHHIIAKCLERTLDLSIEEIEENACRMEHIVTDAMVDAMERALASKSEVNENE